MKRSMFFVVFGLLCCGLLQCATAKKSTDGKTSAQRKEEKQTAKREEEKKGEVKEKEKQTTPANDPRTRTLDRPLETK